MAAVLQPGSQVAVVWKARLEGQMGTFTVEPVRSRAAVLGDRLALAGLSATCALLRAALPEREAHWALWRGSMVLLDALAEGGDWPALYLRWEVQMLEALGFGLDLSRCAVTGSRDDLAFVSPKTGRAVSRQGAGDWAERLLPLPQGLMGQGPVNRTELAQGLAITGHFLTRELSPLMDGKPLPEARGRLLDLFAKG
jgi:DNA repair protein RecO (recombination protein O)